MHDRGHLGQAQIIGNFLFINDLPGPLNPTGVQAGWGHAKNYTLCGQISHPEQVVGLAGA